MQGGHILALVTNDSNGVEHYGRAGHGKHAPHDATDDAYTGLGRARVEEQLQPSVEEEEVEGYEDECHTERALHACIAEAGHVFNGYVRGNDVEHQYNAYQSPTDVAPIAQGYQQGGGAGQQAREGDAFAKRGEDVGEEHHDKDAETKTSDPLDETGHNGEEKDEKNGCPHDDCSFASAKVQIIFGLFSIKLYLRSEIIKKIKMKNLLFSWMLFLMTLPMMAKSMASEGNAPHEVTPEGAWCWFADPRAVHYENADGSINRTYIGYIDVHGNVKAMQYDLLTGERTEVLVRSYFQPDDHNNPTFLVLPDERVMIFYSRHTDEACFYYRVSTEKGDITTLGEEKRLATNHNTTYPSPFILSDDPNHIYLCWRGLGWHPTIAQLSMPTKEGDVHFTWGPYQMVKSTGARPYAKYQSNGKDKILLAYTTGHPDNEMPNHLYFNYINVNTLTLEDVNGHTLSKIAEGPHHVNKRAEYAEKYPDAVVDKPMDARDWLWQVVAGEENRPAIAMVRIDDAKESHDYYYARWDGSRWQTTFLANGGGHFHQTPGLEKCYSGGMAIDEAHPNVVYCSVPVEGANGRYYEIVKYTVAPDGKVTSEAVTRDSKLNNVRPYMIPSSDGTPLRLTWMQGYYYDWIVSRERPGYPTAICADYVWKAPKVNLQKGLLDRNQMAKFLKKEELKEFTFSTVVKPADSRSYPKDLLTIGNLCVRMDEKTQKPTVHIGDEAYESSNRLVTADSWRDQHRSTNGKWYEPSMHERLVYTVTCKEGIVRTYINGLLDQTIRLNTPVTGYVCSKGKLYKRALNQEEVKGL